MVITATAAIPHWAATFWSTKMERPLILRIAVAIDGHDPIGWLADLAGVTPSTAKTWCYGHKSWAYGNRRPPIPALRKLLEVLRAALPTHPDKRLVLALTELLKGYIWEREREPVKPRAKFNLW